MQTTSVDVFLAYNLGEVYLDRDESRGESLRNHNYCTKNLL